MKTILNLENSALLAILAATDAVFIPSRHLTMQAWRVRCEHRNLPGIPWSSDLVLSSRSDTARKQAQRVLDELVDRGLVTAIQPSGAKTLFVRLTDEGDEFARAMVGLPRVETTLKVIEALKQELAGSEACDYLGDTWVPETVLAGVSWGDRENRKAFVELEEKLLPGLVRHWVKSNCSNQGHTWYALGTVAPWPVAPLPEVPEATEEARIAYYTGIKVEGEVLNLMKLVNPRELGDIPMPVSPVRRGDS